MIQRAFPPGVGLSQRTSAPPFPTRQHLLILLITCETFPHTARLLSSGKLAPIHKPLPPKFGCETIIAKKNLSRKKVFAVQFSYLPIL